MRVTTLTHGKEDREESAGHLHGEDMNGTEAQVPKGHPLMKAWEAHKATEEYANSKKWAAQEPHVDGSLWALFVAGWNAGTAAAFGMEAIAGPAAVSMPQEKT